MPQFANPMDQNQPKKFLNFSYNYHMIPTENDEKSHKFAPYQESTKNPKKRKRDIMDIDDECYSNGQNQNYNVLPGVKRQHTKYYHLENYFLRLPNELIQIIFSLAGLHEVSSFSRVCKDWTYLSEDNLLWLSLYHNKWKNHPENSDYIKINPVPWKLLTKHRKQIELEYFFAPSTKHNVSKMDSLMYIQWGDFLCSEITRTEDFEKKSWLFFVAFQEYDSAFTLDNESYEALIHWGDALSDMALTREGKAREELFYMSHHLFERAKEIVPIDKDGNLLRYGSVDLSRYGII
eukprot:TRINITY_DN8610_c0_g1_i1.p1 TRINITY_DN8610_c0_g1~~TRINITY_DN8610_c0_g1_i1.p1  ORF type:complete len:314 (-),score=47.89 TRINITY_DN8610_c0_g1_i1:56-931(-)